MSTLANVLVEESQSPEAVRSDLLRSLRTRQIHHKFHYESYKQSRKWLALHQAYAPSRTDDDCIRIYEQAFEVAASRIGAAPVELVGLGCGGGQKDGKLLDLLRKAGAHASYIPCDVSLALVLTARNVALQRISPELCRPLVCDLGNVKDLRGVLGQASGRGVSRVLTFFGMIPNFEPSSILPALSSAVTSGDWLLFSANLAPGSDYASGVKHVLPGYDNELTRDWLGTFMADLGLDAEDGAIEFTIEEGESSLLRIVARHRFTRSCVLNVEGESFAFAAGDTIRLFFSYRHTPETVSRCLGNVGLRIEQQWLAASGEEAVFLCRKK